MEEAIRDESDLRGAEIVEVVPVQQLVEHGLIDEGDQTDAEQDAGPQVAPRERRTRPVVDVGR